MNQITPEALEEIIRKVVAEQLGQSTINTGFEKYVDESGVAVIKASTVKCKPFDTGNPADKVFITDILDLEESPRLGCGMMEIHQTTFDWTLEYDEVDYIVEGTLKIIIDGREVVGRVGDVIFIPKGSTIQFSAPDFARFMFVAYPANWEEIARQKQQPA